MSAYLQYPTGLDEIWAVHSCKFPARQKSLLGGRIGTEEDEPDLLTLSLNTPPAKPE